jgi:hypothetical protein
VSYPALGYCSGLPSRLPEDLYARLFFKGAHILTDAATVTQIIDYVRLLQKHPLAILVQLLYLIESDRFVGNRAMLLTDHAIHLPLIGQAMVLIDHRSADDRLSLEFDGQLGDRTRWTNLAAEGAVVFTVTETGDNGRGVKALEARLE